MSRYVIPLGIFLLLMVFLAIGLGHDPHEIPSPLINKPAPAFQLAQLQEPAKSFSAQEMRGKVWLLNVWASWCVPCRDEAALLMTLAADRRLRVVGMNYKDQSENARRFLGRYGNPFAANGIDANGRAAIEWGVYGVPETFVIGRDVRIAYKLIGPVTPDNLQTDLKPAIERALANP